MSATVRTSGLPKRTSRIRAMTTAQIILPDDLAVGMRKAWTSIFSMRDCSCSTAVAPDAPDAHPKVAKAMREDLRRGAIPATPSDPKFRIAPVKCRKGGEIRQDWSESRIPVFPPNGFFVPDISPPRIRQLLARVDLHKMLLPRS